MGTIVDKNLKSQTKINIICTKNLFTECILCNDIPYIIPNIKKIISVSSKTLKDQYHHASKF